jgi:hypothetical protein
MTIQEQNAAARPAVPVGEDVTFAVALTPVEVAEPGFNRFGVKTYDDGSIDVIFKAMEPGVRKGIRVTETFLRRIADNFTTPVPLMLDHSGEQLKQVGQVRAMKFADGFLRLMAHVPNTGNSVKADVIADLSYEPPAITDGSVGLSPNTTLSKNDDNELEFTDGSLIEFSLTPFPGGYDDGGLSPQFAATVEQKLAALTGDEANSAAPSADSGDAPVSTPPTPTGTSRARVDDGRSHARISTI